MLIGCAFEPADGTWRSPARPEPIFERPFEIAPKPTHQFSHGSVFVIEQRAFINQLESSREESRRNVRVLTDLSTDKAYEHSSFLSAIEVPFCA
jgi:hypothetical protein